MGFLDKAKELGNATLEKSKDIARITKLNLDLNALESRVDECKKIIGDIFISKGLKVNNEEVNKMQEKANNLINEIESIKQEIRNIQNKEK